MSPYEILFPGGSVEYWNEESGETWINRLLNHFKHSAWINPTVQEHWQYTQSTQLLSQLMEQRMMPMTVSGIEEAMDVLNK